MTQARKSKAENGILRQIPWGISSSRLCMPQIFRIATEPLWSQKNQATLSLASSSHRRRRIRRGETAKGSGTNGRLGAGHCKAFRPCSGFCPAAKAMDRGTDIRMARKMPPSQPRCRGNTPSLTSMAHRCSYPQIAAKNHSDRFLSQALRNNTVITEEQIF